MSNKSKICAIGEKKLIGPGWFKKSPCGEGPSRCAGCAKLTIPSSCDEPSKSIEDGGCECIGSIWIACDPPQPEAPAVEECAGCRFWKEIDQFKQTGDCRRYPPKQRGVGLAEFPETRRDMWCGEWKAK